MMRPSLALVILCFASTFCRPSPVSADVIQITDGTFIGTQTSGTFDLIGDDFAFTGGGSYASNFFGPSLCNGGTICTSVNLGATFSGIDLFGTVTLDGITQSLNGISFPSMFLSMLGSASLPLDFSAPTSVSAPFTLSGSLAWTLLDPPDQILGQGIATISLTPGVVAGVPYWQFEGARYDFTDASVVPEPASLWLLGSGLLSVAWRQRRKKGKRIEVR
jgi:hypothetical protein